MRRWLPSSLRGQLLLAVLLALAVAQAIGAGIAVLTRQQAVRAAQIGDALDRTAALVFVLERTTPDLYGNILRAAETPLTRLSVAPIPSLTEAGSGQERIRRRLATAMADEGPRPEPVRVAMIARSGAVLDGSAAMSGGKARDKAKDSKKDDRKSARKDDDSKDDDKKDSEHDSGHDGGPRRRAPPPASLDPQALMLSVPLVSGAWLNAEIRFPRPDRGLPLLSLGSFALAAGAIGLALWLALARLLGPLRRLAGAAEGLGRGEATGPLPATGPSEMRALTEAFNLMQQRLHRMVSDRTQMLAALGHDLRSPLTALRVQAEMVEDDEDRARLLTSLAEMQDMVEQTLTYARGVWTAEAVEDVDLGALLTGFAAEEGGAGAPPLPLRLPAAPVVLRLRPATIRRALRNLIDNARRYGGQGVTLALIPGRDSVAIEIADDGPGIPPAELARVFDPFVRLEASRSRETGGTGLGLSIARSIVQAHGGEVVLTNRPGGGLLATVQLPRPAG